MAEMQIQLEPAWQTLTDTLGVAELASRAVFTGLSRRYSEPSRFYHTLTHVAQMLHTVETRKQVVGVQDPSAVRLAVWFHDAVYDSRAGDDEEQSARLAADALSGWNISGATAATVERLILATKTHIWSGDHDGALFLDADLAILGSDADSYARYARAIRQEYAWVPDADYRAGRRRVLANFLERPRLYQTPPLHDAWEVRARENLRAEIEQLRP